MNKSFASEFEKIILPVQEYVEAAEGESEGESEHSRAMSM